MRDKPWPGLRNSISELGEESWGQFANFSMRTLGELRDRPGLGVRYSLQADVMTFLETGSVRTLIGARSGTIRSVDVSSASTYTLASGLDTAVGCFANSLGAVYYCNGVDPMQVIYNGSVAAVDAGIVAPASAPTAGSTGSGVVTAGVHLIRYRYKNSVTGYFSNPSPALEYTAAGSANIPLTLTTTSDAKVDQMVVEMTQAAGSTFYVVATISEASSYTINMSDTTLGEQQLANIYASPDGYGHEPPPVTLIAIVEHRNRLFGIAADGTLYWTRAGFPEAWNVLNWGKAVFAAGGDLPVAMASFYNDLYIFGSRGMARLVYTGDPASGMLVQLPSALGTFSQRSICTAEGVIYGFGRDGIWAISAMQPDYVSNDVRTVLDDADLDYQSTFHMFFDPEERMVWAMYRSTDDTGVKSAVTYDLTSQQWQTRTFRHIITASHTASTSVSASAAYLADSNIYVWRLDNGVWDCVPPSTASGVITATSGSTTTVINTAETLDTIQGLAGAILYDPATGLEYLISSNLVNQVTISTPLGSSPAVGQTYYIGSINQVIESGWIPLGIDKDSLRPDYLSIKHISVTASLGVTWTVEYFLDYSSSAFVFTKVPADAALSGITIVNSQAYCTALLDLGKNKVPMPSNWEVVIKWRLTRTKPTGRLRMADASADIRDDRKAKEIAN